MTPHNAPSTSDPLTVPLAEYDHLWQNLRSGVTILWEAFKTYFTVVGLLFAAVGFFQGDNVDPTERWFFSIMVSIAGLVITVRAEPGIKRILIYQHEFLKRAKTLEELLSTEISGKAIGLWNTAGANASDELTFKVFFYFKIGWIVAAVFFTIQLAIQVITSQWIHSIL